MDVSGCHLNQEGCQPVVEERELNQVRESKVYPTCLQCSLHFACRQRVCSVFLMSEERASESVSEYNPDQECDSRPVPSELLAGSLYTCRVALPTLFF
eukprot:357392-Chlamydomonas_euryale.AAC.14